MYKVPLWCCYQLNIFNVKEKVSRKKNICSHLLNRRKRLEAEEKRNVDIKRKELSWMFS